MITCRCSVSDFVGARVDGVPNWNTVTCLRCGSVPATIETIHVRFVTPRTCGGTGFIEIPPSSPGPPEGEFCAGCDCCDPPSGLDIVSRSFRERL